MQKNIVTYSVISFLIISFFGFNSIISLLSNILILLFLTPVLLILITFLGINFFKNKINICPSCGATSLTNTKNCMYCGENFNNMEVSQSSLNDPSQETIEIEAEEIK